MVASSSCTCATSPEMLDSAPSTFCTAPTAVMMSLCVAVSCSRARFALPRSASPAPTPGRRPPRSRDRRRPRAPPRPSGVHRQDSRLEGDLVEPLDHRIDALGAFGDATHRLHRLVRDGPAAVDGGDRLIGAGDGPRRCIGGRAQSLVHARDRIGGFLQRGGIALGTAGEILRCLGDLVRAGADRHRALRHRGRSGRAAARPRRCNAPSGRHRPGNWAVIVLVRSPCAIATNWRTRCRPPASARRAFRLGVLALLLGETGIAEHGQRLLQLADLVRTVPKPGSPRRKSPRASRFTLPVSVWIGRAMPSVSSQARDQGGDDGGDRAGPTRRSSSTVATSIRALSSSKPIPSGP